MSTDPQCTLKCKDKIVWEELSTLIPKDSSYLLPSVTRDPDNPGHFKTWHQLCDARNALQFDDIGLHFSVANIGNCAKGCRYYFSSEADKSRHIRLVHGGKKGYETDTVPAAPADELAFKCRQCNAAFPNRYQLSCHQKDNGHVNPRGRPKKN